MYSDYKKEQGQEALPTSGQEKHDTTGESKVPQNEPNQEIDRHHLEPETDREAKHPKRLPKRKFVTTVHRRMYYETRSKTRNA